MISPNCGNTSNRVLVHLPMQWNLRCCYALPPPLPKSKPSQTVNFVIYFILSVTYTKIMDADVE